MKFKTAFKKNCRYIPIVVIVFYSIVFLSVLTYPVSAEIINPYDPIPSSNETNAFYMFEGQAYVFSKGVGSNLYLYAEDGGQIFREFTIQMFANQKAFYQIKIDDQVFEEGEFVFRKQVKAESAYSTATIKVTLKNLTGVELPSFVFADLILLDVGEVPPDEPGGEISPIIEPYIRMTQGEMNAFIAIRLVTDISLTILGFLVGSSLAVIKTDYQGVEQVG